ncbi:1-aminocyclopropane-1-carboxylate deaminase [Streptomyces sp. NPDC008150]|uniref:1-aminocyclopropane-1-carboxylate deaminase n=1 Tax=Streptomyces sp. NPDC008150 TaxID=3364816 RepID=UPI0036E12215
MTPSPSSSPSSPDPGSAPASVSASAATGADTSPVASIASVPGIAGYARYPLLFGPSPVHPLERLTAHLGGAALWAKREDCNSGVAYGGNKTRKLEYLVADALAQGCDTLVSIGGVQSNHTRQVAAVAARAGLKCVLVQESWVDWPDSVYDRVGNILISRLAGADVRLVRAGFGIGFKESWEQALKEVEDAGGRPYAVPAGASDHPLGGLGFAGWAHEVAEQEREAGVFFDTVVVCSVTGSTQAGMVAGFRAIEEAGGRPRRVLGVDASAAPARTRAQIARIARRTGQLIGVKGELTEADVELDERYHAGTYGIPDEATLEAMRLAARTEGMVTDPVYEGKSMAGMADLVRRGEIGRDSTVLYAHLGGQPALNAYSALF